MDNNCLTGKNPKIKEEIPEVKEEIPDIKTEIPEVKKEIAEVKEEILSQSDIVNSDKDDDSDYITSNDDDDDSDFEPLPKKKPPAKARKPAAKKTKAASKNVKTETDLNVGDEDKPPAKKRKTFVKRTKAVSKKIKTEDGFIKEEVGENEETHPPTKKRKAPVKRTKGASKKTKTEDGSINVMNSEDAASADPSGFANNEDACDIAKIISNTSFKFDPWNDEDVVAETTDVPVYIAKNVMTLLDQECTIPFIVRYRKEKTGGLMAEKLRDIQTAYDEVKQVHKKVENILKTVKNEKFDDTAKRALLSAKSLEEVEFLYAPFKPGSKRSLAERSKQLGLEPLALQLFESEISLPSINFNNYIKQQKGLQNEKEILTGIQHIIADAISKDRRVLDYVRIMSNHQYIKIQSTKSAAAEKEDRKAHVEGKTTENFKYENYYKLNILIKHVAHHQVMAVNRGEKNKVLTVKIEIPFDLKRNVKNFIWNTFFKKKYLDPETFKYLRECVDDSYDRLIEPYICRQIRSDLTKKAEKESIAIFCSNVRSLLLTPPVRGKTVVGIDPGFAHGCKVAVVSSKGEVLKTDVIYPHRKGKNKEYFDDVKLKNMISEYGAEIIAIGNGTACRETEQWLSNLINSGFLRPYQIKYCIVNESGVSIYSVTKEAEAELPNMDPNIRSAVAIARRLQDPLLEYVKIEPKHLGVGMYQHDVPEAQLKKGLDSVVEECVSFVGVDLNVCPEFLLRKISGLSAARAKQIVEWRNQHGGFINRQQLREVKGLGPKSFEQCAGFVKILPETSQCAVLPSAEPAAKGKKKAKTKMDHRPNPLDRTIVHPESYSIAEKFLQELKANPDEVGMQSFVDKVNSYMKFKQTEDVAKSLNVAVPVMQLIIDAFKQLLDYDIRGEFDQPLFMTSVRKYSDLKVNQELTGRVMNIAGFGAFVDVGVERDGLIHTSKMLGQTLSVGERVTVKVITIDFDKKRLGLQLVKKS